MKESKFDSYIQIYANGTVVLKRNDGEYHSSPHGNEVINTLPVIDYLRAEGFEFKY